MIDTPAAEVVDGCVDEDVPTLGNKVEVPLRALGVAPVLGEVVLAAPLPSPAKRLVGAAATEDGGFVLPVVPKRLPVAGAEVDVEAGVLAVVEPRLPNCGFDVAKAGVGTGNVAFIGLPVAADAGGALKRLVAGGFCVNGAGALLEPGVAPNNPPEG